MSAAQFPAGMAFNNSFLGYVHAMAHQLGGQYNLPHGVCNAMHDLARAVGIPARLSELGMKREDIPMMAVNAMKDGSGATNPRKLTQAEIEAIYEAAF